MKKALRRIVIAAVLFALDGAGMWAFRRWPELFFPAFRRFSKVWIGFLAALTSFFPYSLWDIGALLLSILLIGSLIHVLLRKRSLLNWLSIVVLCISLLCFEATGGWLLNHYAPKLSAEIALPVREYSKEELAAATEAYLLKAAEYASLTERNEAGRAVISDISAVARKAGASYGALTDRYPVFAGSQRPVKRFSLIGEYLMYNGIIGMFMPVTGEASVPSSVPPVPLPFTMCHEAAHRLGIASEQEANFAAFLACLGTDDPQFLYSGYSSAFSYCFSSLYQADPKLGYELYHRYDELPGVQLVQRDRQDTSAVYDSYASPLKEVSDQVNDTYLKTFSQESGIRSYGEVTDYLIAWYLTEMK
ncbi:MAG: DUF3810 domain-containing protein [Erysipelotrichaceae bacterium]|nr:DUF3810 domain-containing protein [Erysipelotrichaceae bacterium]